MYEEVNRISIQKV